MAKFKMPDKKEYRIRCKKCGDESWYIHDITRLKCQEPLMLPGPRCGGELEVLEVRETKKGGVK